MVPPNLPPKKLKSSPMFNMAVRSHFRSGLAFEAAIQTYSTSGWFNYTNANGTQNSYHTLAAASNANDADGKVPQRLFFPKAEEPSRRIVA